MCFFSAEFSFCLIIKIVGTFLKRKIGIGKKRKSI